MLTTVVYPGGVERCTYGVYPGGVERCTWVYIPGYGRHAECVVYTLYIPGYTLLGTPPCCTGIPGHDVHYARCAGGILLGSRREKPPGRGLSEPLRP